MPENFRSQLVTKGVQRAPNRAMLRAVGFEDSDFTKPIIGVANAHSTITPCNMGINGLHALAEKRKFSTERLHYSTVNWICRMEIACFY